MCQKRLGSISYHPQLLVGDLFAAREKVCVMRLNNAIQLQVVQILLLAKGSAGNVLGARDECNRI